MNPAIKAENERERITGKENIVGEDIGVGPQQKVKNGIARENTGGDMNRSLRALSTDEETVTTMSTITRDGIGRILAREAGHREVNGNVISEVLGGVMDDRIILGLQNALRGSTKRAVVAEMDSAAPVSTGLLTGPANIREDYLHLRQKNGIKHQITTQIH